MADTRMALMGKITSAVKMTLASEGSEEEILTGFLAQSGVRPEWLLVPVTAAVINMIVIILVDRMHGSLRVASLATPLVLAAMLGIRFFDRPVYFVATRSRLVIVKLSRLGYRPLPNLTVIPIGNLSLIPLKTVIPGALSCAVL